MRTYELLSIIGAIATVGIALGAVMIGSNASLRTELRTEMRTEMQGLRTEVRTEIRSLETRLVAVERRQARAEGLLEGLRDAIAAQRSGEPRSPQDET